MKRMVKEYGIGLQLTIFSIIVYNNFSFSPEIALKSLRYLLLVPILILFVSEMVRYADTMEEQENKKKVISRGFWIILLFSIILIFKDYLMGNKVFSFIDIGNDMTQQYVPYYYNCAQRIRDGEFHIWNWDYGLGTSWLNNLSQTLDPFGLFVILTGALIGPSSVTYLVIVAHVLKIITAYILCKCYLRLFGLSEWSVCVGAYLYAFNGYLMCWGQHYLLGTAVIYVLLVLIAIEKILRSKELRWSILLSLSVFASIIYSYYNSYMILIFAGIYFMVRVLKPRAYDTFKERLCIMIRCLWSVVSGLLMAGFILIPVFNYLTVNSFRLDSEASILDRFMSSFFSYPDKRTFFELVSRMLSNNLLYINQNEFSGYNYYEMAQFSITIFGFVFIGQYLVCAFRKKEDWIYNGLIVLIGVLMLFNPGIGRAFNGFAYTFYRYSYVLMPVFGLLIAYVWEHCLMKKKINIPMLLLSVCGSIFVLKNTYQFSSYEVKSVSIVYGIIIIAGMIVLCWYQYRTELKQTFLWIFMSLLVISTITDSSITNNMRVTNESLIEGVDKTKKAIAYIEEMDSSFYRVEKTYADWSTFGDSFMCGHSALTCYNSTINRNLCDFYYAILPHIAYNNAMYHYQNTNDGDVSAFQIINLKYILSKTELTNGWCELIGQVEDIYIYRNIYADSSAMWYTDTISKDEYTSLTEEKQKQILGEVLIVNDEDISHHKSTEAVIGNFYLENDAKMVGMVECSDSGILTLAIPDQEGWDVYVDGERVETINANYGFIGVKLDAGQHEITATYTIPKLQEGIVVSAIGLIMFMGMLFYQHLSQKTKMFAEKERGRS